MMVMCGNAGVLWGVANQARDRARDRLGQDPTANPQDVLVAITFSAMTAEAFLTEFADGVAFMAASRLPALNAICPALRAFTDALAEIEVERGSIKLKYLIASRTLSGRSFDKGANPYQDFSTLINLRNDIVHLKQKDRFVETPTGIMSQPPSYIAALQQRKLAIQTPVGTMQSWFSVIQTLQMADWAIDTTRAIGLAILNMVPPQPQLAFHPVKMFGDVFDDRS